MASQKVEICLKKKKPTSITNIPLLSFRKSEQQRLLQFFVLMKLYLILNCGFYH